MNKTHLTDERVCFKSVPPDLNSVLFLGAFKDPFISVFLVLGFSFTLSVLPVRHVRFPAALVQMCLAFETKIFAFRRSFFVSVFFTLAESVLNGGTAVELGDDLTARGPRGVDKVGLLWENNTLCWRLNCGTPIL